MSQSYRKRRLSHTSSEYNPAKKIQDYSSANTSEVHATFPQKEDYTIGWICAVPVELAAASAMLDEKHDPYGEQDPEDTNNYRLGRMGRHNIVMTCLPEYGTTPAATVAKDMLRTFKSIKVGLLVGIGAGVPSKRDDIRLGDVVVSNADEIYGGVVQWDRGKSTTAGRFEGTGTLNKPPLVLRSALADLRAQHLEDGHCIDATIGDILDKKPVLRQNNFQHQGLENDDLYNPECSRHIASDDSCESCGLAEELVPRPPRPNDSPVIHYGTIASGNQVIKNGHEREKLRELLGAKCIEKEAAGLMDSFPCIVIKGICDYADSRKNKRWQPYAALAAAAYAKELLSVVRSQQLTLSQSWNQVGRSIV